jgi:SAM-dependent methyltransferase
MMSSQHEKVIRFLHYFASLHSIDEGYVSWQKKDTPHVQASKKLFKDSIGFLEKILLPESAVVLDVGMGYGYHCGYLAKKGYDVTGITTHVTDSLRQHARDECYTVKKMDMHFLEFEDETFDLVWSHHSLEHSFSPLLALREWYRVTKKGGCVAVTVPPHKDEIVSGHFNIGWNIGHLMYLLGICGFNVKSGFFVEEDYNVRALVKKPDVSHDPTGLSWMFKLKEYLPNSVQNLMVEVPSSLGKFSFNGALNEVTNETCLLKTRHIYREKKLYKPDASFGKWIIAVIFDKLRSCIKKERRGI